MATREPLPVSIPVVAHKGPHDTDAAMFRVAARKLRDGYDAGGSNVRAAVADLLDAAAAALDDAEAGPP